MHTIQENKALYRTTSSPASRNIRKTSTPPTSLLVDVVEVCRAVRGQTFVVEVCRAWSDNLIFPTVELHFICGCDYRRKIVTWSTPIFRVWKSRKLSSQLKTARCHCRQKDNLLETMDVSITDESVTRVPSQGGFARNFLIFLNIILTRSVKLFRSLLLPANADADKITAKFALGWADRVPWISIDLWEYQIVGIQCSFIVSLPGTCWPSPRWYVGTMQAYWKFQSQKPKQVPPELSPSNSVLTSSIRILTTLLILYSEYSNRSVYWICRSNIKWIK